MFDYYSILRQELKNCFMDYDGDFSYTIELEHEDEPNYFMVTIIHKFEPDKEYNIPCKIDTYGNGWLDYHEDSWELINKGNMFCYMWFDK